MVPHLHGKEMHWEINTTHVTTGLSVAFLHRRLTCFGSFNILQNKFDTTVKHLYGTVLCNEVLSNCQGETRRKSQSGAPNRAGNLKCPELICSKEGQLMSTLPCWW